MPDMHHPSNAVASKLQHYAIASHHRRCGVLVAGLLIFFLLLPFVYEFPAGRLALFAAYVALLSGVLSAFLGLWLYLAPVHTVAPAERDIVRLMARLTLSMQEGERSRIARDLHDGVGQAITFFARPSATDSDP